MSSEINYINLSKEVSYALRHAPWKYELELDENGWVSIDQLLQAFHQSTEWKNVELNDLKIMIEKSEKKRHEIRADKIRAFYGHTIPAKIKREESIPPQFLYHGTSHKAAEAILKRGLLPCSRQYVHLSQDRDTAREVGKRRDEKPIIFVIQAEEAYKEGIKFYIGNEKVWLADFVPPIYIKQG